MNDYNFILNSFYNTVNVIGIEKDETDDLVKDIDEVFKKTDVLFYNNYKTFLNTNFIKYEKKFPRDNIFIYVNLDTKQRLNYNGGISCNRFTWNIVNILNIQNGTCYVNILPKNIIGIKMYPFRISKNFLVSEFDTYGNTVYVRIVEFDSWGYIGRKNNGEIFTYHLSFLVNLTPDDINKAVSSFSNYRMLSNLNYAAPEIEIKKVNEVTSLTIEMYDKNGIINFPVEESDYSLSVITLGFKTNVRSAGTYLVVTLSGGTFESLNEVVYLNVTSTQPEEDKDILELLNNSNGIQLLGSPDYYGVSQMNLAYDYRTTQIIFIPSLANLVGTLSPVGKLYIDSRRMLINMELECLDI